MMSSYCTDAFIKPIRAAASHSSSVGEEQDGGITGGVGQMSNTFENLLSLVNKNF